MISCRLLIVPLDQSDRAIILMSAFHDIVNDSNNKCTREHYTRPVHRLSSDWGSSRPESEEPERQDKTDRDDVDR